MTIPAPPSSGVLRRFDAAPTARIAFLLRGGAMSAGDIAALRRMDPWHPPLAFFKLEALAFDGDLMESAGRQAGDTTRWAAIVAGLAHLGRLHRDARDDRAFKLGRVLSESGYSELRFSRLLQADADRLVDDVPMLGRYIAAKLATVDWTGAARLILSAGRKNEESVRRHLARDYFAGLAIQERR